MVIEETEKFEVLAPNYLPRLLGNAKRGEKDIYDEYALIPYKLNEPATMEDVLNQFEDQMYLEILYVTKPSTATVYGRACCAFSRPSLHNMVKLNAMTNASGLVDTIMVTVYASLEMMGGDLETELHAQQRVYKMDKCMTSAELLSRFSK